MAQTLCIKCGSELKASSYCQFCQQPLIFACTSCEYITDEKVHPDCRNAEVLSKTDTTNAQEGSTVTTTADSTTFGPRPTIGNQQEQNIVNKSKEEMSKAEQSSASSYMKTEHDDDKNGNINPFTAGSTAWQSLMTYWMYTYGESVKNSLKMTGEWCNIFWKPWVNWLPKNRLQNRN